MPFLGCDCVALVRTNASKEHIAPIIMVERISYLGTKLIVINRLLFTDNVIPSSPILFT
jgi:hypothetical protein